MSLRRGSSVPIGGTFERLFCPEGREFEQANLQKFKCPGGGGMLNFRIDWRIIQLHALTSVLHESTRRRKNIIRPGRPLFRKCVEENANIEIAQHYLIYSSIYEFLISCSVL